MHLYRRLSGGALAAALLIVSAGDGRVSAQAAQAPRAIPRTADGRPNLDGIWQVRNRASYDLQDHLSRYMMPAGRSVVEGGEIPYQPWAAAKKAENFAKRAELDPLNKCFMAGLPRMMYLEWPFQIMQTRDHIAMAFEWTQVYRLIYTNGTTHDARLQPWMGDARGRWEGDTLVVDVANHNEGTWLDAAGNFHSDALHLVERYTMRDADTIQYEVTIEDPKVFTRPWKISMPLYRQQGMDRILEYHCQAEKEEAAGDFEPDPRTWYPGPNAPQTGAGVRPAGTAAAALDGACLSTPHGRRQTRSERLVRVRPRRVQLRSRNPPGKRRRAHAGGSRRRHRSGGRAAPLSAVGARGTRIPRYADPRLRRSHRALLSARCAASDLRADAVSHRADTRLGGHAFTSECRGG